MTLRGTTSNSQTSIGVVTPLHFSLLGKKIILYIQQVLIK